MQLSELPKLTQERESIPLFAAGVDIGAASAKIDIDLGEVKIPSAIERLSTPPESILKGRNGGFVSYLDGSRHDLKGTCWYAGDVAIKANPKGHQRVSDDASANKIGMSLQLLLAALTQFSYRPIWNIKLVASHHDASTLKPQIAAALQGSHRVLLAQHDHESVVNITVLSVVHEGMGLVVSQQHRIPENNEVIALDLGGHSTIATVFDGFGQIVDRNPIQIGVIDLIESIAKNPKMRERCNAQQGDTALIRAALESAENRFAYGYGRESFNIQDIYEIELQPWLDSALAKAWKSVEDYKPRASHYFAIGGGVNLPHVAECLAAAGLECLPDSEWINARGLYTLAAMHSEEI
ncbi:hypothetical protein H6F67_27245 [Microcoleus sp. FACHB-1515]|uniref:ParM/StbA family protein n=1 Tax=Cyanophyceae TaxID=3028117 RepID=UPI0016829780|nr:hypothetical protein [Microcoleus sp. FACHB-1515]MBD2093535.1 hypothetical protein [Microcoleus sp. FACHB-1515]